MTGLKVNFSAEEASSESLNFDPIPSGEYYARITDITEKEVSQGANQGKAFWNVEFTVQDGEFADRKVWTNAMLFDGALYTLAQLLKATDNADALQSGNVPNSESLVSKEVIVVVKKQRNAYMEAKNGDGEPVWGNEVKGIKSYSGTSPKAKAGVAPSVGLLP